MVEKIINYVRLNIASLFGLAQAIVKFAKEVVTAIINILFPVIPNAKFQFIVELSRDVVNWVDEKLEWAKEKILPVV